MFLTKSKSNTRILKYLVIYSCKLHRINTFPLVFQVKVFDNKEAYMYKEIDR